MTTQSLSQSQVVQLGIGIGEDEEGVAKITKKSLYEGFAKAGYAYISATDMETGNREEFMFLTSVYDPGEILGFARLDENKEYVVIGAVSPEFNRAWGVRKTRGVPRFSAESAIIEFQKMRQQQVVQELPKGGLVAKVKAGRKK